MKKNSSLSRRSFVGASVAAVPAIIAVPHTAVANGRPRRPSIAWETLTNKIIPARDNIIGTAYYNIREYDPDAEDITDALNYAISYLSSFKDGRGGSILIPHGIWTSDGGHTLDAGHMSISIEGAGYNLNPGAYGTEIHLKNKSKSDFVFQFSANTLNNSIKNLAIVADRDPKAEDPPRGTGLLLTDNGGGKNQNIVYSTCVENVGFFDLEYGIKVESSQSHFECILNRFERASFILCQTAFYCNSTNGGYSFDTCYFSLPSEGIAFDCQYMGNLSVEHCLFVGNDATEPNEPPNDGSTILRTVGQFNNISFYDCQDENIEFACKRITNHFDIVPIVYRSCTIQSKLYFGKNGAVVFDSCRLFDCDGAGSCTAGTVEDSSTGAVKIFVKGLNNVYTPSSQTEGSIATLINSDSVIVYESKSIGKPYQASTPSTTYTVGKATRGIVTIQTNNSYVVVYSDLLDNPAYPDCMIFVQLQTYDSGGARIREVANGQGYFQINLTQNAASNLKVAFKIESCEEFVALGDVGT